MKNATIVESNVEPSKENLWLYKGELRWYGPNGWKAVTASDNAPKYIFELKLIDSYPIISLSPGSSNVNIRLDSYTELDGVREYVPIQIYNVLDDIAFVNWWKDKDTTGSYIIEFSARWDGTSMYIIKGREGRNIIVPVYCRGFGPSPTTTSTPSPITTTTVPPTTPKPVSPTN